MTDFSNKCIILGELYANYREDKEFSEFIEFNDLGLPLAYHASEGLCQLSADGERYVEDTWLLFISALGVEDIGFEDLEEMFQISLEEK